MFCSQDISDCLSVFLRKTGHYVADLPIQNRPDLEKSVIENAFAIAKLTNEVVIIPLNIGGNHWVLVAVVLTTDRYVNVILQDPFGRSLKENIFITQTIVPTLFRVCKETTDVQIRVKLHSCTILQQMDGDSYSCGPFLILNAIYISRLAGKKSINRKNDCHWQLKQMIDDMNEYFAASGKDKSRPVDFLIYHLLGSI